MKPITPFTRLLSCLKAFFLNRLTRPRWDLRQNETTPRCYSSIAARFATAGVILWAFAGSASADSRAIEFKNNTGQDADDLHIETTFGSAVVFSQPFLNELQADTRTHNLWGGTVTAGGSAVVRLNTAPGDRATITRWWWTLGGNAESNGVAIGPTNGDNGGLILTCTNGIATGDGQYRVSVGGYAYIFTTIPGHTAQETLDYFALFLDTSFQFGSVDMIESYSDATNTMTLLSNVQGDPQTELSVEVLHPDSTLTLSFRPANVGQPPAISDPPLSQSACIGGTVTFIVTAQGTAPLSYQWERNSVIMPGATSPALVLGGVTAADAGTYRARVSNAMGSTLSSDAILTILQPPTVIASPQSQSVAAGAEANFTVSASGSSALMYQWRRNGVALSNGSRFSGANSPSLHITSVQAADGGAYDATVANLCGTRTSGSATLTVNTPTQGTSRVFVASSPIAIPSEGRGSIYPSTVSVSGMVGTIQKATVTLSNLNHTFPGDLDVLLVGPQGQKTLLMSDVGGSSAMDNVTLTLDSAASPAIPVGGFVLSGVYRPTDSNVDGSDGFPAPAPAGPYGTDLTVYNGTNPNGTWSLFVVDDTVDDLGMIANGWSLRVTTSAGETGVPPAITTQPQDQNVPCHGNATFVVMATGTPPLSYRWQLDGVDVAGATDGTLSLSQVNQANTGVYVAVVTNAYGAVTSAPATLVLVDSPPRITTTRTATHLNLSWPDSCEDYVVETAEQFTPAIKLQSSTLWQPLDLPAELVGGRRQVDVPLADGNRVFRLAAAAEPSGTPFNPYNRPIDAINQINGVDVDSDGLSSGFERVELSASDFSMEPIPAEDKNDEVTAPPSSKINPVLTQWLATHPSSEVVSLIVTFQEDLRIPRLPELSTPEEREQASNPLEASVQEINSARHAAQAPRIAELRQRAPIVVLEQFWLANSVEISTALGHVTALAQAHDVVYIQPVEGGEEPPDGNPLNDVDDGRRLILSDAYFAQGLVAPWIGLLDTGVRSTHVLFNAPRNLDWLRDCVNGGANCAGVGNPGYDTSDLRNHGTSSAAILSGNNRLGNAYRGATAVRLDSWKVYPDGKGLNTKAVLRGLQRAVAASDKVIVCELQADEAEDGAIASAADNAYNAGAIVVAPAGDAGPGAFTVRSPAIAHKVLGVGAYQVDTMAQYAAQGRGPARDGRYKPDVQAPTGTETASAVADNALRVYNATSGAAPYAGATAMLARNWLQRQGVFDNGQTYAWMILYGQRTWPYNNVVGAGPIRMAVNGRAYWGKVNVRHHQNINIPINVLAGRNNFEVALWWPESAGQRHNDIDVRLIDPNGVVRARGISVGSVFERTTAAGPLAPGRWRIRISGFNVPTRRQVVYWSAMVHF